VLETPPKYSPYRTAEKQTLQSGVRTTARALLRRVSVRTLRTRERREPEMGYKPGSTLDARTQSLVDAEIAREVARKYGSMDAFASISDEAKEKVRNKARNVVIRSSLSCGIPTDLAGLLSQESEEKVTMATGLSPIDSLIGGGFAPGLYTIAGKAGAGKTALALQIGAMVAHQYERKYGVGTTTYSPSVLYVTTDITSSMCWARLASMTSTMGNAPIPWAHASADQMRGAAKALEDYVGFRLGIKYSNGGNYREDVYPEIEEHRLMVVDYMGLLNMRPAFDEEDRHYQEENEPNIAYGNAREQRVCDYLISGMREEANNNDHTVILVVELTKEAQKRLEDGGLPRPTDTLGSSSTSYAPTGMLEIWQREGEDLPTIWCVKNRRGPRGKVRMEFDGEHSMWLPVPGEKVEEW